MAIGAGRADRASPARPTRDVFVALLDPRARRSPLRRRRRRGRQPRRQLLDRLAAWTSSSVPAAGWPCSPASTCPSRPACTRSRTDGDPDPAFGRRLARRSTSAGPRRVPGRADRARRPLLRVRLDDLRLRHRRVRRAPRRRRDGLQHAPLRHARALRRPRPCGHQPRGRPAALAGPPHDARRGRPVQYTTEPGLLAATDWAAAAFNGFEGGPRAGGLRRLVIPVPGDGGLVAVAAGRHRLARRRRPARVQLRRRLRKCAAAARRGQGAATSRSPSPSRPRSCSAASSRRPSARASPTRARDRAPARSPCPRRTGWRRSRPVPWRPARPSSPTRCRSPSTARDARRTCCR